MTTNELLSTTLTDLVIRYNAIVKVQQEQHELEMERTAWFTSLLMNASGNYKKKIKPTDLFERESSKESNKLDRDIKNNKLKELIDRFKD